ncbi:ATP synthase subunit C [Marispirochaeta aestuarii]|jgi:V/A-type H+-transporting ATPase subunit K|uniref:ATP synthase subunit C n=1 Tax=Marispirochaeta aestuarii TaxID=1963862 RepID=UPI0029C99D55|nr:ATP synthase subunit C [Marispirochaeta aestuarii]
MDVRKKFRQQVSMRLMIMVIVMAIISLVSVTGLFAETGQAAAEPAAAADPGVQQFGLIAAALAFGLGAIGAGIAISHVGAAAMGAIGEKPEIAGQALIFIALAEGLVVFGFITALMILGKI